MAFRLETARGRGIPHFPDNELPKVAKRFLVRIDNDHPRAIRRTAPSGTYNCHGLTFASRRTRIETLRAIQMVLDDDVYTEILLADAQPGDVVIYYSAPGDPSHSGMVVAVDKALLQPLVCSKWGSAGEYVHALADVPELYGSIHRFFRCCR